jgi:pseudaminic acid cytidylyltransferase
MDPRLKKHSKNRKQVVATIHARGGSKRVPKKNIKNFCGKPAIYYPIRAAIQSHLFDRIVVNTDSEEIAAIGLQQGAEVPFMRPQALADDYATTQDVLKYDVEQLNKDQTVEYVCCIYAAAVLVQPAFLKAGLDIIRKTNGTTVFSVATSGAPVYRALQIKNEKIEMVWPEYKLSRSQDLPETYQDAGQFYWINVEKFKRNPMLINDDTFPVILPRYLVQDIDTEEDWAHAEIIYKTLKREKLI